MRVAAEWAPVAADRAEHKPRNTYAPCVRRRQLRVGGTFASFPARGGLERRGHSPKGGNTLPCRESGPEGANGVSAARCTAPRGKYM